MNYGDSARVGRYGLRNCSLNFPHDRVLSAVHTAGRSGQIDETSGNPASRTWYDKKNHLIGLFTSPVVYNGENYESLSITHPYSYRNPDYHSDRLFSYARAKVSTAGPLFFSKSRVPDRACFLKWANRTEKLLFFIKLG